MCVKGREVGCEKEEGRGCIWVLFLHSSFQQIRASIFTVVATLCKQAPDFIRCRAKQFCSLVLSSLGESEPVVVGPLWEAALLVVTGNEVRPTSTYVHMYIHVHACTCYMYVPHGCMYGGKCDLG